MQSLGSLPDQRSGTPHISAYNLTYEPNTPITIKTRLGLLQPTEETIELEMMHAARHRLIATNRLPYEISNYAIDGEACQHNLLYWTGGSYVGIGPSAASHIHGTRFKKQTRIWANGNRPSKRVIYPRSKLKLSPPINAAPSWSCSCSASLAA